MTNKATRTDVVNQVKILDIANLFNIGLESIASGNFDCRCKCPHPEHKSGREKTPSLYINSRDNNFYCYGCNIGSSVIDFYMACTGLDFLESLQKLKEFVKVPGKYQEKVDKKKEVLPFLIENSEIIRSFLIANPELIDDFDSVLKKIDNKFFEQKSEDPEAIDKVNQKLKEMIKKYENSNLR